MGLVLKYVIVCTIILLLPCLSFTLSAQDRCGTDKYTRYIHPDFQQKKVSFENWLQYKKTNLLRTSRSGREQAPPYKIPVVVHVIHNGEATGVGTNISDAQILSQIKVLNEDFRRQNADASNTPAAFAAVAGSLDVEFVLARTDPQGLATNGIERVNGGRNSWTMADNYTLKEKSYWPAEQYFNIWVCNLSDQFVGYAQFPETDLEGAEVASTNRLTDGVVIWYRAFGSIDDGTFNLDPSFNKGRTLTHEVGHYLGLLHIWGSDSNCVDSDYVSDTPNQKSKTEGCPAQPVIDACGEVIMFQNFLDYSDDDCMNLFTQGQVSRMTTVIENSPRRNSLLTSPGLLEPNPLPNDLGVWSIVVPDGNGCSNALTPLIEIRNYGENPITTSRISLKIDGIVKETIDFPLTLDPQQATQVSFSPLTLASGQHEFTFTILSTNGVADGADFNNRQTISFVTPVFTDTPFVENFSTTPTDWIVQNPDGLITWEIVTAPKETLNNKALKINFAGYEDKIGEIDIYLGPVFDLSTAPAATLSFDVAHARWQQSNDRLRVVALRNCEDISSGVVVYDKAGDALKTAPATTLEFIPKGPDQWRKELLDLSALIGTAQVQLAFVGINDYGNNIYLDNIAFFTDETVDVSLLELLKPSVVTCAEMFQPSILIQNTGSIPLTSLEIEYTVNGAQANAFQMNDLNVLFGQEREIELPLMTFSEGINTLSVNVKNPNGMPDPKPANNNNSYTIVVNTSEDKIPLRQNFDGDYADWTTINPGAGMNWEPIATNYNASLYFNGFSNTLAADEAWLVSPVLDLSAENQASLVFDLSYASGSEGAEGFRILASTDCGSTFHEIKFNLPEPDTFSGAWTPQAEDDWNKNIIVNLDSLVGQENVRIAFVVRHQNGNNVFIDNIEFFTTANPDLIEIDEIFSIYGYNLDNAEQTELKITFNLPERQDVHYTIVTMTGQMEVDGILRDVLNQTLTLDQAGRLAPGMYIVRLRIGDKYYATKILIAL